MMAVSSVIRVSMAIASEALRFAAHSIRASNSGHVPKMRERDQTTGKNLPPLISITSSMVTFVVED